LSKLQPPRPAPFLPFIVLCRAHRRALLTNSTMAQFVEAAGSWVDHLQAPATLGLPLPRGFGLVLLVVVHNWLVLMWQALNVGKARKRHGVRYPALYETGKEDSDFNRVQRAHQNSLEWNPAFASCPLSATAAGVVYNLGRVAHARGYYAGSPHRGLWGLYGLFYLIACTVYTAWTVLTN
jgi:glutathione S-transferase